MLTLKRRTTMIHSFLKMFNGGDWVNLNASILSPVDGKEYHVAETVTLELLKYYTKMSGGGLIERLLENVAKHVVMGELSHSLVNDGKVWNFEYRIHITKEVLRPKRTGPMPKYFGTAKAAQIINTYGTNRPNARVLYGARKDGDYLVLYFNCPDHSLLYTCPNVCVRFMMLIMYLELVDNGLKLNRVA